MFFASFGQEKGLGSMSDMASKLVIPWWAIGESPFEYAHGNTGKCMEITDGTLNDESFNKSWSEILIKEKVPCKVDIPSLLHSLFK